MKLNISNNALQLKLFTFALSLLTLQNYFLFSSTIIRDDEHRTNTINDEQVNMKREIHEIIKAAQVDTNQEIAAIDKEEDDNIKCLSFGNDVEKIVNSTKQVFIAMPAKVAGSSLGSFVMDYCMKDYQHLEPAFWGWWFNLEDKVQEMLTLNVDVPSILSSHLGKPDTLVNLVKGATDESLIVYVHRRETDRYLSGIRQVGARLCKKIFTLMEEFESNVHIDDDGTCTIDEEVFLNVLKRPSRLEVRNNVYRALSCDLFDAVKDNRPNMVVLNYRQADKLQYALAKKHCPEVLSNANFPVHINEVAGKQEIVVKLKSDGRTVTLRDWTQTKKRVLEFAFGTKRHYYCTRELKKMERKLFSCDDGIVQL